MNQRDTDRDKLRIKINKEELIDRMLRMLPEEGFLEAMPGLFLGRSPKSIETQTVHQPAFCFVVQGSKKAMIGKEVFRYDSGHYLIFTVDLPIVFRIEEASQDRPYLGFALNLDPKLVASVIIEAGIETARTKGSAVSAIGVERIDSELLDTVVRLIRLLDNPREIRSLAPLVIKELIVRLLQGGQASRLHHLLSPEGDKQQVSKAIGYLRSHFNKPLRIESIARQFGMSVSGFHQHFKNVTAMSPLQFQKQLRLQEARRLMLGEDLDAANAGFQVGYEDPAYFSRDYKKLFGAPPQRDIFRLRSGLHG